jgi:predicted nucleic acid-binding protein
MRVFLDANVLFSAAKSDGAIRELLRLLVEAGHECWVDDYVVAEARRNLLIKGPAAMTAFEALLTGLRVSPQQAMTSAPEDIGWLPDKDRPVLAAAIRLRCDALVTGDRTHFGDGYGKTFGGVAIHSPRSFAESFLE